MSDYKAILQAVTRHGNKWSLPINTECEALFNAQQKREFSVEKQAAATVKGIQYGPGPRHRLDVYSPGSTGEKRPVVVYFHGGGFVAGDNDISEFLHGNIGHFFASHSYVCVLATYRLLPDARFPEGAEDIASCLTWISSNIARYGGDSNEMHVLGQSAGGAHLAMALFSSRLSAVHACLKTVVLLSVPFCYDLALERRRKNMLAYYNATVDTHIRENTSLALFQRSSYGEPASKSDYKLVVMVGQYDSDEIMDGNFAFLLEFRKKMHMMPLFEVLEDQNHVSYALGIGLQGETLGPRLLAIIQGSTQSA